MGLRPWLSRDGRWATFGSAYRLTIFDISEQRPRLAISMLSDLSKPEDRRQCWMFVSPDGHVAGSPDWRDEVVYVVERDDGVVDTLSPDEFDRKYNWTNDPNQARLFTTR